VEKINKASWALANLHNRRIHHTTFNGCQRKCTRSLVGSNIRSFFPQKVIYIPWVRTRWGSWALVRNHKGQRCRALSMNLPSLVCRRCVLGHSQRRSRAIMISMCGVRAHLVRSTLLTGSNQQRRWMCKTSRFPVVVQPASSPYQALSIHGVQMKLASSAKVTVKQSRSHLVLRASKINKCHK
jgi:hypothetical protein